MAAEYVIRLDDICPTMKWEVWDAIEGILTVRAIRPLLAVVPDNRDPKLQVSPPRDDFWERARQWKAKRWTIALHGYRHLYETADAGLVGLNRQSEFAGVARDVQVRRLREAAAIFRSNGLDADTWIAPAHSFDEATIDALRDVGVSRLSDGLFLYPGVDGKGMLWVPQQLWEFIHRPFGVWTVCLHINSWSGADVARFEKQLDRFAGSISDFESVCAKYAKRRQRMWDRAAAAAHLWWIQ